VLVASSVKSSADKALVLGDSWAEYSLETLQDRVSKRFQSHHIGIDAHANLKVMKECV
jgi:hypothetical protein